MAITYIGKGTHTSSTLGISIPPPSSIQAGDVLITIVENETSTAAIDTPSGWNAVADKINGSYSGTRCFWRVATSSEGNAEIADTGSTTRGIMTAWRGVDNINPINAVTTNVSTGSTYSVANPTSTVAECMLINCIGFEETLVLDTDSYSAWANTSLVSITEGHDYYDVAGGVGGGIAFAYGIKTTAGAINNTTATRDTTTAGSANVNLLLQPAIGSSKFFLFM